MFVGREKELKELENLYVQNRFQLFILYGRRRVGKTTLLKEFCKNKEAIFYSAEQSNEKLNLEKFSVLVFQHYNEENLEAFAAWEKAILYINEKQQEKPLVLVFDEFPYMAAMNKGLLSNLQHLVDHKLKDGKLFLILCGSYMAFMEKEVLSVKSPLFGRRTAQLHMKTFDYRTSIKMLDSFSIEEKLELYGAFGGTPMYLGQIRKNISVKENIVDLFLKPTGYLYEEPLLLLKQEVQEPGVYSAIIEAIAGGASKANEIATKIGEGPAKCLKYIKVLIELGILYKETPFGEKESSRKTIYCVSDFMFRFWYRYVFGNKTLLETDAQEVVWKQKIQNDYSHYMGLVFEKISRQYLLNENAAGNLPLLFTEIGRWWGTDAKTKMQIEIDIVAKDGDAYLFGECKWRNEPIGMDILAELRYKADVFLQKREKSYFVLFSKSGFIEAVYREAEESGNILLIDIEKLTLQSDEVERRMI